MHVLRETEEVSEDALNLIPGKSKGIIYSSLNEIINSAILHAT